MDSGKQAKKVRETRLRRAAERQGLVLRKSGRRDPLALDFEKYVLIDQATDEAVIGKSASGRYELSIDEVEAWLTRDRTQEETT